MHCLFIHVVISLISHPTPCRLARAPLIFPSLSSRRSQHPSSTTMLFTPSVRSRSASTSDVDGDRYFLLYPFIASLLPELPPISYANSRLRALRPRQSRRLGTRRWTCCCTPTTFRRSNFRTTHRRPILACTSKSLRSFW